MGRCHSTLDLRQAEKAYNSELAPLPANLVLLTPCALDARLPHKRGSNSKKRATKMRSLLSMYTAVLDDSTLEVRTCVRKTPAWLCRRWRGKKNSPVLCPRAIGTLAPITNQQT